MLAAAQHVSYVYGYSLRGYSADGSRRRRGSDADIPWRPARAAGTAGIYAHTFPYGRKDDCPVCSTSVRSMTLSPNALLGELVEELCTGDLRLKAPSLASPGTTLYMRGPARERPSR